MRRMLMMGLILCCGSWAPAAWSQIKPETSGKSSFYEPEPNPHGPGWTRPNMPGDPPVKRTTPPRDDGAVDRPPAERR